MLWTIILVLFFLALLGGPYTGWHNYGWTPSGLLGLLVIILLVMVLLGHA